MAKKKTGVEEVENEQDEADGNGDLAELVTGGKVEPDAEPEGDDAWTIKELLGRVEALEERAGASDAVVRELVARLSVAAKRLPKNLLQLVDSPLFRA